MEELDILKEVEELYVTYLKRFPKERINSSELLNKAGSLLLTMKRKNPNYEIRFQRHYLMKKVAADLLMQATDMSYTKQYDLSQIPKKLRYLAFELIFECYDSKPNKVLIPYLNAVIAHEKYNHDQSQLLVYKDILKGSIDHEEKFLNIHKKKLMSD